MSEKVALFGGTFNPPHAGHARAFRTFCEKVCPDVVYVMPASVPPHKEISGIVNPAARFHMAHLALDDISENAVFSALEISRRGKSFSVDTVNELLSLHDCDKIYMYVGSDMLFYFEKWKDFEILFKNRLFYIFSFYGVYLRYISIIIPSSITILVLFGTK